jgi:fatty acid desaturase
MNSNFQPLTEREVIRNLLEQLKPFFNIEPAVFYFDILTTGLIAWVSLFSLQLDSIPFFAKILLGLVSYSAFYRGLMFIHEAVHFNKRVPGFRHLYNFIFGFPCRIPFYIHDPHRYHHLPNTFGTQADPEYAYLKGTGAKTLLKPFLVGILSPFILIIRFGILPLISWTFPKKWNLTIYQKASTIIVNPSYLRPLPNEEDFKMARSEEVLCSLFFLLQIALFNLGIIKVDVVVAWLTLMIIGAFINVWRARIAHRYDNPGGSLSPLAQLRDSITVEKKFLSFLWAPAGMQYHSLHHLAPQIPYYNLQAAHESLIAKIDSQHPYSQTVVKNPKDGFKLFYKTVINEL